MRHVCCGYVRRAADPEFVAVLERRLLRAARDASDRLAENALAPAPGDALEDFGTLERLVAQKLLDVANYDVLDMAGLMTTTSGLARKDATHITGTVDLTRSTGVSAPTPSDLEKAGPGAAKIPFTATVDDQGRLIDLVIQADAVDRDLTNEYAFSNIGKPGPVAAPAAADVATTPASVYQIFNGF